MASPVPPRPRGRRALDWASRYPRAHGRQFGWFAVVGVISTVAFVVLYVFVRSFAGPLVANFVALSLTMWFNFAANRTYTFRARQGAWKVQGLQYLVVYVLGLGASSAVLHLSLQLASKPPAGIETLIALAAGGVATVVRFVLLSAWVFRRPAADARDRAEQ